MRHALLLLVAFIALVHAQYDAAPFSMIGGVAKNERGLCCNASTAAAWQVPMLNPFTGVGCPSNENTLGNATAYVIESPGTDPVIAEFLQFFPYCQATIDDYQAKGKKVIISVTPKQGDPVWEGFKAGVISEAFMISPALNVSIPIPLELVDAFDQIRNPYKSQWEYVDGKPAPEAERPTCRMIITGFLAALIAQNRTTLTNAALLLPYRDDCECGCRAIGSNPLLVYPTVLGGYGYQQRFLTGQYHWNITVATRGAVNLPDFPVNSTTPVALSNFTQSSEQWPCYLPWIRSPSSNPLSYCGIRCPSTFRTESQYKEAAIMMGILGWISYLSTLFVFATMICMPRYRHFPANLVLFVLFCSHVLAFAFVFTITRGWRRTVCSDPISPRWGIKNRNAACIFNGLTIIWGGLGTTFFWCAVAINSFIAIYLKRDSILRSRWFEIATHVICWGVPSVSALIAVAAQQIGTPQQLLFCFVTEDPYHPKDQKGFSWQYPLFFGPIGFCIVVASGAIVMVLYEMRNLRAASGSGRFNKHIRIALFLVVFLGIYAFVFGYRFTITADGNQWREALTNWAGSATLGTSQVGLAHEPSFGLLMAFNFFIGCQGVLVALLFGSNTDVLTFWGERVQNIREGRSFFSGITSYTASSKVGASSVRATGNAE